MSRMRNYPNIGIQIPDFLLPKPGVDLTRWAVIACDQFTSQPEYWQNVEKLVGDAPSTFNLTLPEVYLGTPEGTARIQTTQTAMRSYLEQGILVPYEGMVYVERTINGLTRHGLMMALDLEKYNYNKGSQSLIRATEGTILDRLPPRIKIREGAPLELPHILVLIDDPDHTVIEPLSASTAALSKLYDFDLMLGSGHLRGFLVDRPELEQKIVRGLEHLSDPNTFARKYGVAADAGVLLFAMGDGNHSLATAKAIWEKIKTQVGMDHPARYALVEIENVHDAGLHFEPIHRVLFGVQRDMITDMRHHFGDTLRFQAGLSQKEMVETVDHYHGEGQAIGFISPEKCGVIYITQPTSNLPVGTLQSFLDDYLKLNNAVKIDYVHGEEVVTSLGSQPGNTGFYVPAMNKSDLFKTVILDGALPRKTFSMGEAKEKRFYMESRKIG
jgi:hypothetical protein